MPVCKHEFFRCHPQENFRSGHNHNVSRCFYASNQSKDFIQTYQPTINSARFIPSKLQICNPQLCMLDVGMSQCLASTSDPAHFACSGTDASHQR